MMNIEAVKKAICIPEFKQTELLEIALTHPSHIYENLKLNQNQKDIQEREYRGLAILGDAILGAVVLPLTLPLILMPRMSFCVFLPLILEPQIKQAMQELEAELPDPDQESERFDEWRKFKGRAWVEKLTSLIGYNLQFSEQQKDLLKEYYKANKSLVENLNNGDQVSKSVRQETENTLLLPIDLIE